MATLIACAVRDSALDAFNRPIFVPAVGLAVRSFADEVRNPQSDIHKHPEDYELFEIGAYVEETGELRPVTPRSIARGTDYKE